MHKKVLLLTTTRRGQFTGTAHEQNLLRACEALANENTRYFAAAVDDISIQVKDGVVAIQDLRNGYDLTAYALVHFLNVHFARDHFMAVALYLNHHKITWVCESDVQGTAFSKISQMVLFALGDIPVPDTLAVWDNAGHLEAAQKFVQPPFIMKSNDGTKGLNNHLVKNWDEYTAILKDGERRAYILQPFLPNDGDFRFLYLGDEQLAFHRRAASDDTHLNNSTQGGQGTMIPLADCNPEHLELARRTMEVFGREIGGVDILVDKQTGKPYVLEVNHTPAIFSGLFQREKIAKYAAFVQAKIKDVS